MDRFFTPEETSSPNFRIKVIADISCDINGAVPITYKATTIEDPVIGWDKVKLKASDPFGPNTIDIMAVSNLPTELPIDASESFGRNLIEYVIPELLKEESEMITDATICENGILGKRYAYLSDYAQL
jgi:hypothetical protein